MPTSQAEVGDLVRFRCEQAQFFDGGVIPDGWIVRVVGDERTIITRDAEETGIVREVRDDGLFVECAPQLVGALYGTTALVRTVSTLVAFDDIIDVVKAVNG